MKRQPKASGTNKSGAEASAGRSARTAQGAQEADTGAKPSAFAAVHARFHSAYTSELEQIGRVPPPAGVKGMAKSVAQLLKGRDATVLLDAIGGRIAFERTGTRLYDGLILKHGIQGAWKGGPSLKELTRIRDEELAHFHLLVDAMRQLGGDPTAMTPMADVNAVASTGLEKVISDARTTLPQALHAIHIAELADGDAWTMLARLTRQFGLNDLATRFDEALDDEAEHLVLVRGWLDAYATSAAGVPPAPAEPIG